MGNDIILIPTQVEELTAKKHVLSDRIDIIQENMRNSESTKPKNETNNYNDNVSVEQHELIDLVRERAGYDSILESYVLSQPSGDSVEIGSLVTYVVLDATNPSSVGVEKNIMIVQRNYSNARPKDYIYVSLDTVAGRAFLGTKAGDVVTYQSDNGNSFKTLVVDVDNNYYYRLQESRQKSL